MADLALFEDHPVDVIVGREPSWLVRSGITLIFVVILALLVITWFIRYPDSIYSKITLTTLTPPSPIISKTDGRITRLFVSNGEQVKEGDPLLLLENSIKYEDIKKIQRFKNSNHGIDGLLNFDVHQNLDIGDLGELQITFNQFHSHLNTFQLFNRSSQLTSRLENIKILREKYQRLQKQLKNKYQSLKTKLDLEIHLFAKNQQLSNNKLITDSEFIRHKNELLDKKLAINDINIQIELYYIKLQELEQQLPEFKILHDEKKNELSNQLLNAYSTLFSKIDEWEKKYLLTATTTGTISFSNFWSVNQYIKRGENIINVIEGTDVKIGRLTLDQQGAGKVKAGQKVFIELDSFPANEFGKLEGEIKSISLMPEEQGYLVNITLPQHLTTTHTKKIPFKPNMIGNAKIITDNRRLFERFFDQIFYSIDSIN